MKVTRHKNVFKNKWKSIKFAFVILFLSKKCKESVFVAVDNSKSFRKIYFLLCSKAMRTTAHIKNSWHMLPRQCRHWTFKTRKAWGEKETTKKHTETKRNQPPVRQFTYMHKSEQRFAWFCPPVVHVAFSSFSFHFALRTRYYAIFF